MDDAANALGNSDLAAFDKRLLENHVWGQWKSDEYLSKSIDGPRPAGRAAIWTWQLIEGLLEEACAALPEPLKSRRSLMFHNPALPRGATHTINMGVQRIEPGEIAPGHRHSISALRFVVRGHPDLKTIVDGKACAMCDYDLILTPNWSLHEHRNGSDQPGFWLDVLDVPLVMNLNQVFFDPSATAGDAKKPKSSPFRYPWSEMKELLRIRQMVAEDPFDGWAIEYINHEGQSVMPTLGCWVQAMRSGWHSAERRRTSSAIYFVVEGSGVTYAGNQEIRWTKNDCFTLPNWTWISHKVASADDAILFSVHDLPAIRALGFYREQAR